jgi:hypothetical protein
MGDRCYSHVTTLREFQHFFEELGYFIIGPSGAYAVELDQAETHRGNVDELRAAALKGIPFLSHHDAGHEYGSEAMASDGTQFDIVSTTRDYDAYVVVRDDGKIRRRELNAVRRYLRLEAITKSILDGGPFMQLILDSFKANQKGARTG